MIRLSQTTTFEIDNSADFARDLDSQPYLYLYEQEVNTFGRVDKLFIQDDTSTSSTKRKYSFAPFWRNTLLGTTNFFPSQSSMNIQDYHVDAELHKVLNKVTLPTIEYKQCYLYFTQGELSNSSIVGNAIRLFCRLSNGTEVTLAAIADFKNDTKVTAVPNKIFESQIFAEALRFEIPDVDFILNSNDLNIVALKQRLFGNEKPSKIYIEYSSFDNESVDEYLDNSLNFTRLNFAVINEQTLDVELSNAELFAKIELGSNGAFLRTSVAHQKYLIEPYMNTLKEEGASYLVEHYVTLNVYDVSNILIGSSTNVVRDPVDKFAEIQSRPVVSDVADHMNVELTIRIENQATGAVVRRSTSYVVTSDNINNFKSSPAVKLFDLKTDEVTNKVTKEVKQIIQSAEVPNFVQLTKKFYVQSNELSDALELLDANFTTNINVSVDITNQPRTFLKIDNLVIQNEEAGITTFRIPSIAYLTKSQKYLILDADNNVITQGKIIKTN